MNKSPLLLLLLFIALALHVPTTVSVTCNPVELSPCMSAITGGTTPSSACCEKLREQQPCLCQYMKDPSYQKYISSPNARKVSSTCGVPMPSC
ncbi:hypothetical protein QJS10_CPA01g01591 [Acorus calamus]|uniref:Bifunctional inhibitor/plant lipid transfer protein/seed storage helical domain-containing protein n=1 Tax=Acorus calamus TaxID=4465 RepID=A0AAV9FII1_ACOCL|nr:hypothetical protein QJS10_CPA01g01591 [Acorus calamus]